MARSPAEIQADIALTRRVIERRLDGIARRLPRAWWTPWALGGGALAVGLVLSRVSFLRLVGVGVRTVQTSITVAGTMVAVDRFLGRQRRLPVA